MNDSRREFLERKRAEVHGRALMDFPKPSELELTETVAFQRLFDVLETDMVVRYPHVGLLAEIGRSLGPRISYLIVTGDYELGDLELIEQHVMPGDRVVEFGGGAGLTAAMSARRSGCRVVVVEPNERLFPVIRRQVELNGGSVTIEHGCVFGGARDGLVDFFIDEEIWFSSMTESVDVLGERSRERATAPALDLGSVLLRHQPDVIVIDIEGAERDLFVEPLELRPRKILVEIDYPMYGEVEGCRVVQSVIDQGYRLIDIRQWTHVFERSAASPT